MKTSTFQPSQRVIDQVKAIIKMNNEHQAGIKGYCVDLFFKDRFTKDEIKYMRNAVDND